jgi:hypothetical protein
VHKRSLLWSTSAVAAAALYISACGGSDPAQQDAAVGDDAGAQYDTLLSQDSGDQPHDSGPATIGITQHLQDFVTGEPVEGVECCLEGTTNCATTGATGTSTVPGVPASSRVTLVCTRADYVSRVIRYTTGPATFTEWDSMFSTALVASWAQAAGYTPDSSKGLVFVQGAYIDQNQADTTFTLTPTSGVGPVYFDNQSVPAPSLTDTDEQPYAFFANVEPGDYVFSGASPLGCAYLAPFGWEGQAAGTLELNVVAGTLTNGFLSCQ